MPRDLLADRKTLDGMPQLSRESASSLPQKSGSSKSAVFVEQRFKKMKDIHPFAQLLNYEDLDDCDWLEHAAFDAIEAASREKVSNHFFSYITRLLSSFVSSLSLQTHALYHNWAAVRRWAMRLSPRSPLPGVA